MRQIKPSYEELELRCRRLEDELECAKMGQHLTEQDVAEFVDISRLRAVIDSLPTPVYFKNREGAYLYCNDSMCELIGLSKDEIIGKTAFELAPRNLAQRYQDLDMKLLESGSIEFFEANVINSKGASRLARFFKSPYRDSGGHIRGIIGVAYDVTDQKEIEENLARSERLFRLFFETNVDYCYMISPEGVLLDMNPAALKVLGYAREELIGQSIESIYAPECKERCREVFEHWRREGEVRGEELTIISKMGQRRHVLLSAGRMSHPNGDPMHSVSVQTDITERKKAEERVRIMAEMLDTAPSSITVHDFNGQFLYANQKSFELHGYTEEEFMALNLHELDVPESESLIAERMRLVREKGEAGFPVRHFRKDGTSFPLKVFVKQVTWGGVSAMLSVATDITKMTRAEQALRNSEEFHRVLIENIPDVVMRFDREGRHLFVSKNVEKIVNFEPDRFIGKTHRELGFAEDQCDYWEKRIRRVFDSGQPLEEEFKFDSGTKRYIFDWRLVPEFDLQGKVSSVLSIGRDVTEHRLAEENYQTLFREMLDGFALHEIILDDQGTPVDYRFLAANPAFERLTGLLAKDIIGKRVLDVLPGMEPHWIETYGRVALTGEPAFFENYSAILDKQYEVTAYRPASGQFACIFSDVTERRRARQERERMLTAIEQTGEMIIITDCEGAIQYVNPAFERITGYSREEAIGENPRILKSGLQNDVFYLDLWNTISRGESWQGRMVNKRKDGTLYTEDAHISPVLDGAGQIANYVAVKRDVTKELEAEKQYRQAQKMEAIGQLTGGVAHDFNNLLQVINGGAELAMTDLERGRPVKPLLEEISRAGDRAARLVQQLLLFSRRQVMMPEVLDMNCLIEELLKMLRRLIGEHIRLQWKPGNPVAKVYGDRGMLEQAVMNLCINGRDAMPDGGTLMIQTENRRFDEDFCFLHSWAEPGDYVQLSVTDTGCGMAPETMERIFEPFFTTKEEGRGTGLGLATAYGVVKQHDGFINVESELGQGTSFYLYLPYHEVFETEDISQASQAVVGGTETVLLAEDDAMVRRLAKMILERAGYTVLSASDGREAIEVFRKNLSAIDLVILDVVMPTIGGCPAFEEMRKLRPDIRAIFSTGYSESSIQVYLDMLEDVELVRKPYDSSVLLGTVREVLDKQSQS